MTCICEAVSLSTTGNDAVPSEASAPANIMLPELAAFSVHIGRTVAHMHKQAGGILRLVVVDGGMLNHLRDTHGDGNCMAAQVRALVEAALRSRAEGGADALTRCATCSSTLRDGAFQIAVAVPDCPAPGAGLTMPVCSDCAVTWPEVRAVAWPVLAPLFGGIRVFGPQPEVVGHA